LLIFPPLRIRNASIAEPTRHYPIFSLKSWKPPRPDAEGGEKQCGPLTTIARHTTGNSPAMPLVLISCSMILQVGCQTIRMNRNGLRQHRSQPAQTDAHSETGCASFFSDFWQRFLA
jgi:hypothetical protein